MGKLSQYETDHDRSKKMQAELKQEKADYIKQWGSLRDFGKQGTVKIKESFRWMAAPEFKIENLSKNKITIKGVAVRAGDISKNRRKYVGEEIGKAARTWIKKPVTINHSPPNRNHPMYDGRKICGHVVWSEYEDNRLECALEVNKQPYVDMIRNKSAEVKGLSIEADYLYNRCAHCGKNFYTVEAFKNHMVSEHFVRNFNYEPRGLVGTAISIVLSPDVPGVAGTEIITETRGDFNQLCETIMKESNMKKEDATIKTPEEEESEDELAKKENPPHPVLTKGESPPIQKTSELRGESTDKVTSPTFLKSPLPPTHPSPDEHGKCPVGYVLNPETNFCDVPNGVQAVEFVKIINDGWEKYSKKQLREMFNYVLARANFTVSKLQGVVSERMENKIAANTEACRAILNVNRAILREMQVTKANTVKESADLTVRVENLEGKQKGQFKGKTQRLMESEKKDEYYVDPQKVKVKKRDSKS